MATGDGMGSARAESPLLTGTLVNLMMLGMKSVWRPMRPTNGMTRAVYIVVHMCVKQLRILCNVSLMLNKMLIEIFFC